ncbi:MAG TPA: glycoside hydrolase family 3 C-terminal domain-containing protein, partial [Terriglobales bacterium]|nr:glycoside hydrolase family 3 C-terminal domain-containing protein [Terriglobales bacterium]
LPGNQNALISQIAAANPKTVVVLESGTAVTMPWLEKVAGVLEAWFAGNKGADAVANILFGDVNPSDKLPITFPKAESDLPHPTIAIPPHKGEADLANQEGKATFSVHYDEGLKVGYKWYDAENKSVLFPFGYGLSYTTFAYSGLKIQPGAEPSVEFTVRNTGHRDGAEIAQVYVSMPQSAGEPPKRLVAFKKLWIPAGQSRDFKLTIDRKYLSIFDEAQSEWKLVPGNYTFKVGGSSNVLTLSETVNLQ